VLKGEGNIVASTAPSTAAGSGRLLLAVDQKTAAVSQAGWAPFNEEGGQVHLGGITWHVLFWPPKTLMLVCTCTCTGIVK